MSLPDPTQAPEPITVYQPGPEEQAVLSDVQRKYSQWRESRRIYEAAWFVNAAFYRGQQYVEYNATQARLQVPKAPPHRVRLKINKLQAKIRARISKFLKNRPKPIVVPATNEYKDYLNAKATQKVLDYLWRQLKLEPKYREAVQWASIASKGFWWLHWDATKIGRVALQDPESGVKTYQDLPLGDVTVEVGSPFELLVADPGCPRIGDQPEIIRIKLRPLEDVKVRYPEFALVIEPSTEDEIFSYEQQIANLNPNTGSGLSPTKAKKDDQIKYCLVKEHFVRPSAAFPKGTYRVVAGNILVRSEPELPYGLMDLENPYPVVEFADLAMPGQFWSPTVLEQLVDIQKEYNLCASKVAEHLRLMAFPKIIVAKQQQVPKAMWTSEAGEFVEYIAIPNVPPPTPWSPPGVAQDLWESLRMLEKQFDDVSQIFPASEGKVGTASSGFQTNLLQEATDSVHGPDIRGHELAIEEACLKLRRLVKQGYQVPRLIRTIGSNYVPEIFEFSSAQIDEMADIVVEVGSALPTLKAARQETVLNLYDRGVLGDPADPEVKRRTLSLLEMGAVEEAFDMSKQDENQARLENTRLAEGQPPRPPQFWENHLVHYNVHTAELKTVGVQQWAPELQRALVVHVVQHARYINPQSALQIAMEQGLQELIPELQTLVMGMVPPSGPQGPPNVG